MTLFMDGVIAIQRYEKIRHENDNYKTVCEMI